MNRESFLFCLVINVVIVFLSGCGDGHRIYAWEDRWSNVQTFAGSIQELCHYFWSDEKCKYDRTNIFLNLQGVSKQNVKFCRTKWNISLDIIIFLSFFDTNWTKIQYLDWLLYVKLHINFLFSSKWNEAQPSPIIQIMVGLVVLVSW